MSPGIVMPLTRCRRLAALLLVALAPACSLERLIGSGSELPTNLIDPASTHTPAGALSAYRGALVLFSSTFAGYQQSSIIGANASVVMTSGILSDELGASAAIGSPQGTVTADGSAAVDSRQLPEYTDPTIEPGGMYQETYKALNMTRGQTEEARGLVAAYLPNSQALQGHLIAIDAYADVLLAELFCSGIPLSTVNYNADYTLQPGSTTQQVLQHAIVLFDSTLAESTDSARVMSLARVGKGRALLDLGQYGDAAQAVADVPDGFRYLETFSAVSQTSAGDEANFTFSNSGFAWFASVSNDEGTNGLDFITSGDNGDPRVGATPTGGTNLYGVTLEIPTKYGSTGDTPVVVADGIEARLIEAEAALQAGDVATWLAKLNALRETAVVPALPDIADPGTSDARVDLLFRERAFWLFLTGHRQGDLRRLIRQYGRNQTAVYPAGTYPGAFGRYGSDVTVPVPAAERANNRLFTGCVNRGA
jgi:hypothetical protein